MNHNSIVHKQALQWIFVNTLDWSILVLFWLFFCLKVTIVRFFGGRPAARKDNLLFPQANDPKLAGVSLRCTALTSCTDLYCSFFLSVIVFLLLLVFLLLFLFAFICVNVETCCTTQQQHGWQCCAWTRWLAVEICYSLLILHHCDIRDKVISLQCT